jgi:endonuclease/exonuclease/phosphatase family metal-dependent hydrolase
MHVIRVATQNIWAFHGDWPARREVLRDGFAALDADLLALQEAEPAQPRELLGDGYELAHDAASAVAIASRWPITTVRALEFDSLVAAIDAPAGRLVFANHCPSYQLDRELERERQAVAVARAIDELAPEHAILAGDLNAAPDSASVRFLCGLQSLDGMSARYLDAWEYAHPGEPGHSFTPENPTMPTGETGAWALEPGRRIDYILVRCSDHGPTLDVRSCERLFDAPVGGAWASDHFGVTAELSSLLPDGRPVP